MTRIAWLVVVAGCGHVVDGQAPPDADPCTGTCECRIDTDCAGVHTFCDDEITDRTCKCAAGYTQSLGGNCEWSGVVADPGFQSSTMWTVDPTASIDVNLNVAGMVEAGAAVFNGGTNSGLCTFARVSQMIVMPKLSRAEPLVMQITFRYRAFMPFVQIGPAFGIGAAWHDDVGFSNGAFNTTRYCLGTGSFAPESGTGAGASFPLVLTPNAVDPFCTSTEEGVDIDHVEIQPANAGECPTAGTANNGDAEADGGWIFNAAGSAGTTAMIEAGVGEGNTRGARLHVQERCDGASLSDGVSIPGADLLASPALTFFNRASVGSALFTSFGGQSIPSPGSSGTGSTTKLCLPAFMRGGAFTFAASVDDPNGGVCTDVVNHESIYDSLKLVNDPSCGTDPALTDPGFESTNTLIGANSTVGSSIARAINDPTNAHTGNGVLQLSVNSTCADPGWAANIITPPSVGANGPALKFFYKAPAPVKYELIVSGFGTQPTLTYDNQWHAGLVCLDPRFVGRNQRVGFSESFFMGGQCAVAITAEQAFVDDLSVTTDPSCAPM